MSLFGVAYRITCNSTSKSYIGVTKQTTRRRLAQHVAEAKRNEGKKHSLLSPAILKYGKSSFIIETIASANNLQNLYALEILMIAQENTITPDGYNIMSGGNGFCGMSREMAAKSAASRRGNPKVIAAHKGKKLSQAHKDAIGRGSKGRIKTEAECHNLSQALTGRTFSNEHRANLSRACIGRIPSPETIAKLSATRKGRKHSDAFKQQQSKRAKHQWAITKALGYSKLTSLTDCKDSD